MNILHCAMGENDFSRTCACINTKQIKDELESA